MKILVLLSRVPYPTEKGDKLRAYHQLRCLSEKHEVVLVALSNSKLHPEARKKLEQICSKVYILPIGVMGMIWNVLKVFFNGKPLQVGYFYRCRVKSRIEKIFTLEKPGHIYCQLVRMADYAIKLPGPKTLDYQDVFSMGVKRRMEDSPWYSRLIFKIEYKRLLAYESEVFDKFTHSSIISIPDRDLIPHPDRKQIHIIPNGVDHDYFAPAEKEKKYDIVFTGNMGYPPNVNAAEFLAHSIFPLVLKSRPETTLLIAGANPHPRVLALKSDSVHVSGWVPDIRDCYAESRVFIAPMRIGTGLQNKLLEAMSMKLPCITSQLANSALGAKPGMEILVGQNAPDYAEHIIRLLGDSKLSSELAEKGYEFVLRNYDWHAATSKLETLFSDK